MKYLELFAGSGAGSIALKPRGFKCIGFSEIDVYAIKNYKENFPTHKNLGDVTKINTEELEDFDLLIGGSPCQDISILQSKGITGLKGNESSLFFEYVRILNGKLPRWFIYENVPNIYHSNNGEDWEIVISELEENYNIAHQIVNTADYGIPQRRLRTYIVGQRKDLGRFDYEFPEVEELKYKAQDLLFSDVEDKYFLSEKMYKYVTSLGTKGFQRKPTTDMDIACTLVATMHKMHRAGIDNYYHIDGYENEDKTNLRRLTPRECAKLQGFPDDYKMVVSDTQLYRIMGNAMSVNVLDRIIEKLL